MLDSTKDAIFSIVMFVGLPLVLIYIWHVSSTDIERSETWYEKCETYGGFAAQQRFSIQHQLDIGKGAIQDNFKTVCLAIKDEPPYKYYHVINIYPDPFPIVLTCNDDDIKHGVCKVYDRTPLECSETECWSPGYVSK